MKINNNGDRNVIFDALLINYPFTFVIVFLCCSVGLMEILSLALNLMGNEFSLAGLNLLMASIISVVYTLGRYILLKSGT